MKRNEYRKVVLLAAVLAMGALLCASAEEAELLRQRAPPGQRGDDRDDVATLASKLR